MGRHVPRNTPVPGTGYPGYPGYWYPTGTAGFRNPDSTSSTSSTRYLMTTKIFEKLAMPWPSVMKIRKVHVKCWHAF
eukprot:627903-Rhodomonas_salina.1